MESNYYIALVGKNPLPIYTTILNYEEDYKNIILLASEEDYDSIGTYTVAENIETQLRLKSSDFKIKIDKCSKSSIESIEEKFEEIIKSIKDECNEAGIDNEDINIILDYTGGTKIMSAVCYSKIHEIAKRDGINCTCVYLSFFDHLIREDSVNETSLENEVGIDWICDRYNVIEDNIVNLHGRSIDNADKNIRTYGNKEIELELDINKDTVCLIAKFKCKNIKKGSDLVKSYFHIKHLAEQLGGSNTEIQIYLDKSSFLDDKDAETQVGIFKDNISEIYDGNQDERLRVFYKDDEII